jgi:hypothetical protein
VDQNPYEISPSVVNMSAQPSMLELCLSFAPGWLRRMFQPPVVQEDDCTRLHNAYRAFFRLNPDTVHWVVTAQDPALLLSKEPWPAGAEVLRLCKQSIDDMPGALMLFWSREAFEDTTQPLMERCGLLIVPKSRSSELRRVASTIFSEEIARKIKSMKSLAKVLEERVERVAAKPR